MNKDKSENFIKKCIFKPHIKNKNKFYIKSLDEYQAIYKRSLNDPEGYWRDRTKELITWFKYPEKILEYDFNKPEIKWFQGGILNVSYNCLDRHLNNGRRNQAAIIWQGEDDKQFKVYTYQMLHREVCRFANVMKRIGIKKGDRVSIYMPMVIELAIAMLACTRIGAPHSIVFAGFSAHSLRDRINDCQAKLVVCSDGTNRAGKVIPLKPNVDEALRDCPSVKRVIVHKSSGNEINMVTNRDTWWSHEIESDHITNYCEPEHMDAEDVLFILYTSGSTGKPKGVFHTTGGYLTYVAHTTQLVFNLRDDIHWCTADIGWVTGHSYIIYGPLALGATSIIFEGVPTYPNPGRPWQICEKFQVNVFYTAPTLIRALMREGTKWTEKYDLSSLHLLGSVGEPINPEAWIWYYKNIGKSKLPIVDTWWQTETGGLMISPLPYVTALKPGSVTLPLPGIVPCSVDKNGNPTVSNEEGMLVIDRPWPGMLRGIWGDSIRFKEQYFTRFAGRYESGDGARIDNDGYFWITGRIDDVINVSGHRMGTAEIESVLVAHPTVAEAAVVGMPHDIKGQAIYAYVTLKSDFHESEELLKELILHVRKEIGPIASPEIIQFTSNLPKTRSGKIMRRILRKIAEGNTSNLGDISTLTDPTVINDLINDRNKIKNR